MKIFADRDRPVQIIFAGKAHPADEEGKRIIQRLMEWCRHSAIQHRVALIEDYDIYTGQKLVQGVNVWLNNPRRPLEASGTSGQKVCFNGGINCSVLDGWWCEGYQVGADGKGINGWAIGEDAILAIGNCKIELILNLYINYWSRKLFLCTMNKMPMAFLTAGFKR